jgi:hypothetical protein
MGDVAELVEIRGFEHSGDDLTLPCKGLTQTNYVNDITYVFMNR